MFLTQTGHHRASSAFSTGATVDNGFNPAGKMNISPSFIYAVSGKTDIQNEKGRTI